MEYFPKELIGTWISKKEFLEACSNRRELKEKFCPEALKTLLPLFSFVSEQEEIAELFISKKHDKHDVKGIDAKIKHGREERKIQITLAASGSKDHQTQALVSELLKYNLSVNPMSPIYSKKNFIEQFKDKKRGRELLELSREYTDSSGKKYYQDQPMCVNVSDTANKLTKMAQDSINKKANFGDNFDILLIELGEFNYYCNPNVEQLYKPEQLKSNKVYLVGSKLELTEIINTSK